MKLLHLLVSLFFISISHLSISQIKRNCATNDIHLQRLENSSKYKNNSDKIEANYRSFLKRNNAKVEAGVRTIPVYVHVIYNSNNIQENISDLQIQSQINVLNADFSATNADVSNVPDEFSSSVADYELQFELISVTRKASTKTSWGTNDDMKKSAQGGVDPISPDTHLNMWICEIGNDLLGYAQFPGGPSSTDGVVMSPQYFGSSAEDDGSFYLSAPYDKGRTATHEIGHYLNLRHIWGDGGCNVDDLVDDTPIAAADNGGCPTYPKKSCTNNGGFTSDMFMNYMDYVDDACMYMFTQGQKTRTAALFAPGGARENLGKFCTIGALTGLTSSNVLDNSFNLSWTATANATDYDVSINEQVTNVSDITFAAVGLFAGTEYTVKVRPNCIGGKGAYSDPILVTTTGNNCGTSSALTLSLDFDDYPEETSWELKKEGNIVASGSGYGASEIGTTLVQQFDFGFGTYSFTINDDIGDGICCDYGIGSYEIKDGNNKVFATGASFGSNETTQFCIISSGNAIPVISDQQFAVDENAVNNTVIGTVVATDLDSDVLSFTLTSDNSGNGFSLNSTSGDLSVNESSALNFEISTSYDLHVQASDGVGGSSSATITVNINDINETPVINAQTLAIDENSGNGVSVGTILAFDEDDDVLDYSITSGNINNAFILNQSTGELTISNSNEINFEVNPTFSLGITVDDGNGASSTNEVTVNLNNVNDKPVIETQLTPFTSMDINEIGTLVGTVLASDEDDDVLTFSIVDGDINNAFSINSPSGDIIVNDVQALNLAINFDLTIEVNDGIEKASDTFSVDIITGVTNANLEDDGMLVYPNPVASTLYIKNVPIDWDEIKLKIFDITGKSLIDANYSKDQINNGVTLSNLKNGNYTLQISSPGVNSILYKYLVIQK